MDEEGGYRSLSALLSLSTIWCKLIKWQQELTSPKSWRYSKAFNWDRDRAVSSGKGQRARERPTNLRFVFFFFLVFLFFFLFVCIKPQFEQDCLKRGRENKMEGALDLWGAEEG